MQDRQRGVNGGEKKQNNCSSLLSVIKDVCFKWQWNRHVVWWAVTSVKEICPKSRLKTANFN